EEKQVVGIVEVIRESYRDPTDEKGVFVAVDVKAVKPFAKPVTLAAVKADARLKAMSLAKHPRLSGQPVTPQEWKTVGALRRGKGAWWGVAAGGRIVVAERGAQADLAANSARSLPRLRGRVREGAE